MKTPGWVPLVPLLVLALAAPPALAWGFATHTLIADDLHKTGGAKNADEIYGASAPDMFNTAFELDPYQPGGLYDLTHDHPLESWDAARTGRERSLALGFCSHNDVWGADRTAHHDGETFGQGVGYVIAKVEVMKAALEGAGWDLPGLLAAMGVTLPPGIDEEVYHDIIEYGIDVLATRIDPRVGEKMMEAAAKRSDAIVPLLVEAYGDELEPIFGDDTPEVLAMVEAEFRASFAGYGQLLTLDEAVAVEALSYYIADFAVDYLAMYGVDLPAGFDPQPLAHAYLGVAMALCAGDVEAEVEATKTAVEQALLARGVEPSADFAHANRRRGD